MGLVPATCKNSENNTPEKMGSQGNPPTFSFVYLQVIIGLPTGNWPCDFLARVRD